MKKSMKPLRQINLFSGVPDRARKLQRKEKVKAPTKAGFERSLKFKNLTRNFLENQLLLPVISTDSSFRKDKILPLVPDEYLERGFPDLVTKHRAFRNSDSVDDSLDVDETKRKIFKENWNDHQIFSMHSELIYDSLTVLTYDGVPEEKLDVIEWIFAEDDLLWHGRKVKAELIPFSFKACCLLCRLDYTILQNFVYSKLTSEYKQIIDYKIAA